MPRIRVELPEHFFFATDLTVTIGDINYGGHLGNDSVLSLLQEARVRFLKQFGYSERDIDGLGIIMVDAAIQYKSEAFHGDVLTIALAVDDLHEHGCDFLYCITRKDSGKEIARAKTGIVFFDYARRKIAQVPPKFASLMAKER